MSIKNYLKSKETLKVCLEPSLSLIILLLKYADQQLSESFYWFIIKALSQLHFHLNSFLLRQPSVTKYCIYLGYDLA